MVIIYYVFNFSEVHFIRSQKGFNLLVHQTYTFAENCKSKNKTSWACSSRTSKKCPAQVILSNNGAFSIVDDNHTHPPPVFYINESGNYVRVSDKKSLLTIKMKKLKQ